MEIKIPQNSAQKYACEVCDVKCSKKNDWNRHVLTKKHIGNSGNKMEIKNSAKVLTCNCGKKYFTNSGLWKHHKVCLKINNCITQNEFENKYSNKDDFKNIVLEIVKSNTELKKQCIDYQKQTNEFQKQMLEVCKNGISNNTTIHSTNTNNSHNKTFNLNVFLNEECKDAMNLTDFMNSFHLKLDDLEKVGTNGYVDGVSNIIIKRLRDMDVNKRPMHCSDAKREIMYIKEQDKWEKEPFGNAKLKKAISIIENKNIKLLGEWKEAHPTWMEYDSPDNDICMNLIIQTMSNCDELGDKVIKKLAKEVVIEKV
jgi:hypothetical protein